MIPVSIRVGLLPAVVLCLVWSAAGVVAQGDPGAPINRLSTPVTQLADPIEAVAHGRLFGPGMKPIDPTTEFIRDTLDLYINRLSAEADEATRSRLNDHRRSLAEDLPGDEMAQRFLVLEFLTAAVAPKDQA